MRESCYPQQFENEGFSLANKWLSLSYREGISESPPDSLFKIRDVMAFAIFLV